MSKTQCLMLCAAALLGVAMVGSAVMAAPADPAADPAAAPATKPPKTPKPPVELPAPVAKTVADTFPGGTAAKVKVNDVDGVKVFEVDIKGDKPGTVVQVAGDGTLVLIEVDVTQKDLPEAVTQAAQKAADGATVSADVKQDIMAEVKGGKVLPLDKPKTVYSLKLKNATQKGSMEIAADGSIVSPPKFKAPKAPKDPNAAPPADGSAKTPKPVQAPDVSGKAPTPADPAAAPK